MSVDSIAPARRRTFTPYVILYLIAATLAVAYLLFLGVSPEVIAARNQPDATKAALVDTQRNVERVIADLDPLKEGVGEVKAEVAAIKTGLNEGAERDRLLMEKVETLERAAASTAEKTAAVQQAKKPVATKPAEPAKAPAQKPGIETGSIEQPKAAAPVKPAQVGVLLATAPSLDALRLSWTIVNDRAADTVRTLHPRYVVNGNASERTFGLIAGPLASVADARAVCKTMSERGMACEVSQYRGNAF